MRILFIGHNGYGYPHTRVRCYQFAKILSTMPGIETAVLSFRDDLAPHKSEAAMYENLRDREKLLLTGKALWRLLSEKGTLLYLQKAHFHAAAPYFLHRIGFFPNYIFDYDDFDIPLSNFFGRGIWNRLFFGSHRWDEITYRLARNAKGCVCASHELVKLMQPENQNVVYIPTGVDDTTFSPLNGEIRNDKVVFLWNGLVWGEPILNNLRLLLEAFQAAAIEIPNILLRIIGGGAEWETLCRMVHERYADAPIEIRDWVEPQEMPKLLRESDVGLLPTIGDDLWLRCKSPTKLFEYMASGLPVIASRIGEVQYVMEHLQTGILARNQEEFTQFIVRLAKDESLRQKLGSQARKQVQEHFSLPVLGENLYLYLKETFPDKL